MSPERFDEILDSRVISGAVRSIILAVTISLALALILGGGFRSVATSINQGNADARARFVGATRDRQDNRALLCALGRNDPTVKAMCDARKP